MDSDDFFRDFGSLASRFFRGGPFAELPVGGPAIDSFVRNGNFVVRAELPGIDAKDVEVNVIGNVLSIRGERKEEKDEKEKEYVRHEMSYGSFERQMTIPEGIDAEKIQARYDKGILELTMPAPKAMSPKKIDVKVEAKKS